MVEKKFDLRVCSDPNIFLGKVHVVFSLLFDKIYPIID
jgi:hypothetical protein